MAIASGQPLHVEVAWVKGGSPLVMYGWSRIKLARAMEFSASQHAVSRRKQYVVAKVSDAKRVASVASRLDMRMQPEVY